MEEKVIIKRTTKSPAIAGILSFFFPGTGALYNRQFLKGIMFIIIFAGLVSMQPHGDAQPFIGIILAGFYIFQIIDAIQTAKSINQRVLLGKEEEIEIEEEEVDIQSGSVFWGAFLIFLGGILLLANFEVISYGSFFKFWPLLVVGIGLKFILDYYSKNK